MITIGWTGNIGAGKSTVARIWQKERGALLIDADILARQAVKPGGKVLKKLVEHFGEEILAPDGSLDRTRTARIAFSNEEDYRALNSIVHPEIIRLIRQEMENAEKESVPAVVVDAALIYEFGFDALLDYVVVVDAPREVKIRRALEKNKMDRQTLERVMAFQLPAEELRKRADYVIENNADEQCLADQALEVFDRIMAEQVRGGI